MKLFAHKKDAKKVPTNYKRLFLLLFLILMVNTTCTAQDKWKEINAKIANAPNDSTLAEAYLDLGFEYYYFSLDSLSQALNAADKSKVLAQKINNPHILITAHNLKSMVYREKGDYENSIKESKRAIAVTKKNKLKKKQHQLEDNMANALFDQNKKDEALQLKLNAYQAFLDMKDTTSASIAQFGIAFIYLETNDLEKAKHGFLQCKKLPSKTDQHLEEDGNLGIIYERQNMLDSAIFYYEQAAKNGKEYPSFYLQNQMNLAGAFRKQGNIQKALTMLLDIKDAYKENSEERDYQYYKLLIAEYYTELNNWERAQEYLDQVDTNIILNKNQYKKKYGFVGHTLQLHKGNYKEALRYYTIYRDAIDSMENARIDSNFNEIASKYELSKKQATIGSQKLKIRNYSLGFVIALALLLITGAILFGYRRKTVLENKLIAEKTKKQEIEIENLRQENKIISMQSMIEGQEEERKRIARDLHDNIGTLMTSIKMKVLSIQREVQNLEKMNIATELDSMIDNVSQQVRRISYSMTPVALDISGLAHAIRDLGMQITQADKQLYLNIDALKDIDDKKLTINIYRIIQEIVQNIIKHSRASEVSIDTSKKHDNLILRIRDNGIGMTADEWENAKSIGTNNIKSRINYLNGEIKLITDIGTHFKITIPLS